MKSKLNDPLDVVTHALHVHIQYVPSLVRKQAYHHDEHSQCETDLTQTTDANPQAANYRCRGTGCHGPNNYDLVGYRELNVWIQASESIVQLLATNAKAGTDAKHSADHREDINSISHPTIDFVSEKGIETGADCHGKAFSVTHEGKKEANHHVHDPSVNTPVEQCYINGVLCSLIITIPECEQEGGKMN